MKFSIKYKNLKPLEVKNSIIKSSRNEKCSYCKKYTNFIDVDFEGYFCSDECVNNFCKKIKNYINNKEF